MRALVAALIIMAMGGVVAIAVASYHATVAADVWEKVGREILAAVEDLR